MFVGMDVRRLRQPGPGRVTPTLAGPVRRGSGRPARGALGQFANLGPGGGGGTVLTPFHTACLWER